MFFWEAKLGLGTSHCELLMEGDSDSAFLWGKVVTLPPKCSVELPKTPTPATKGIMEATTSYGGEQRSNP